MPWSHADDNKLPFVMFLIMLGFLAFFFVTLPPTVPLGIAFGIAMFAACAGGLLVVWLRP